MTRRNPLVPALILALALAFVIAFVWLTSRRPRVRDFGGPGNASIAFLDVGQGDSILIRSPEGKTALIDAGPTDAVVALLRARGISRLDLVVVSHHHNDHYGGMAAVIREFGPRAFLDADSPHVTRRYLAVLREVKNRGIMALRADAKGRTIGLGSINLVVFPQAPIDPREENNNSIGIRVEYGNFSALLTGDSQARERRWWAQDAPGLCSDVRILKLAHHGSRNGTDRAWLERTRPELAVASLGRDNEFGHPHPEVLALLASLDIPLKRTDRDGTITIRTDGLAWSLAGAEAAPEPTPSPEPADPAEVEPEPDAIDLNTATAPELETLPGIGPKLAARIIAARPFRSLDDLARIPEIGHKRAETIRPFAKVAVP